MGRPATAATRLLSGEREPCRVATTGSIALQGLQTIDGIALAVNDRVVVKNQSDARQNGIYTASTGPWYRASDARDPRSITEGVTVHVQEGAVHGGQVFRFNTVLPNIGDDAIQITFYLSADFAADAESIVTSLLEQARDGILGLIDNVASSYTDYPSHLVAGLSAIPTIKSYIRVGGYTAPGDGPATLYTRAASQPAHPGRLQSADGAWWEIAEPILFPAMFGAGRQSIVDMLATASAKGVRYCILDKDITFSAASRITLPSNINLAVNAAITNTSTSTAAGMFAVGAGIENVEISGVGSLRGPYTASEPVPTASYPDCNGALAINGTLAARARNIRLDGPLVTGWGTYGVFAEFCDDLFVGGKTRLVKIGRDGVRMYSCRRPKCGWGLHIENIHPGLSGNVYGLTATRRPTGDTSVYPPTTDFEFIGGTVDGCYIWKAIDTHGGQRGIMTDWVIDNCATAIGIAEGDTSGLNDAPPMDIIVDRIIARRGTGNSDAAAINIVGSGPLDAERGKRIKIGKNCIFEGFGTTNTGAIEVNWIDDLDVDFPTMRNCGRAGISLKNGPITGRIGINVENLTGTVVAAIAIETAQANVDLLGGRFVRTTGTFNGFSLVAQDAGYEVRMHDGFKYEGAITRWANAGHPARISPDSPILSRRHASGNTTGSTGAVGISRGFSSVVRTGTGVYVYTLATPLTLADYASVQVLTPGSGNRYATYTIDSATQITVRTFNTTSSFAAADADHSIVVTCL
jgi:hypothetical protein